MHYNGRHKVYNGPGEPRPESYWQFWEKRAKELGLPPPESGSAREASRKRSEARSACSHGTPRKHGCGGT